MSDRVVTFPELADISEKKNLRDVYLDLYKKAKEEIEHSMIRLENDLGSEEKEFSECKALFEQLQDKPFNRLTDGNCRKYWCLVLSPILDRMTNLTNEINENKKQIEDLKNKLECYNVAIECLE